MLFVVRCLRSLLLVVVCCRSFVVVCWLLFVFGCLFRVVCCLLHVCGLSLGVSRFCLLHVVGLFVVVGCVLFVRLSLFVDFIDFVASVVRCSLFVVCCLSFVVSVQL